MSHNNPNNKNAPRLRAAMAIEWFCSGEILSIISDALGSFTPAAGASPIAMTMYYLQPNSGSSQCAPSFNGGLVAQEGGIISCKKMFSPEPMVYKNHEIEKFGRTST